MLSSYWSMLPVCLSSMARMKMTPRKEKGGKRWVLRPREVRTTMAEKGQRPPSPVCHPSPAKKPSPKREVEKQMEEAEKWVEEVRQLEDVGRSPSSSLTQQLAQMAAEAGPSMLSQEEPARTKLWPTVGGKAPQKSSSRLVRLKRPGSTSLAQLPFERSSSFKRPQSSLFRNSPSCS